jgi:signal transduction histidine kinase
MLKSITRRAWFPFIAFLGAIILVDLGKDIVYMRLNGIDIRPARFIEQTIWWSMWLVLLPLFMWTARRTGPERLGWLGTASTQFVLGLFYVPLHIGLSALGMVLLQPTMGLEDWSRRMFGLSDLFFVSGYAVYAAAIVTYLVWDHQRRLRERDREAAEAELRAARLETLMRDARMDALRRELEPHFLHNALQSISGLVRGGESDKAVRMIAALGGHLRSMLGDRASEMVTLADEVELLKRYVSIEAVRFEDRLTVALDIEPATEPILVPPLLLQPLLENAIRHGVARTTKPVSIVVRSRLHEGRLRLSVEDDGPGASTQAREEGRGVGLDNTRERLRLAFGEAASLTLSMADRGGAEARIDVAVA